METPLGELGASCLGRDYRRRIAEITDWNVFRVLIPTDNEATTKFDEPCLKNIRRKTKALITVCPHPGVGTVMVRARQDDGPDPSALPGLLAVLNYFEDCLSDDDSKPRWMLTRLVIPGAQALSLIAAGVFDTFEVGMYLSAAVYLKDITPKLSHDDVILQIQGARDRVYWAIDMVACHLRKFTVDHSTISYLKARMRTPPNIEPVATVVSSRWPKTDRLSQLIHFTSISPYDAALIIGENGQNIERIRESSPATICIGASFIRGALKLKIQGYFFSEVDRAEKVMQDCVDESGGRKLFELVQSCTCDGFKGRLE